MELKKNFTPGPWSIYDAWDHSNGKVRFSRIGTDSSTVLRSARGGEMEMSEADVTLMVRAHEMLETVERLVKILTDENGDPLVDMVTGEELPDIQNAIDLVAQARSVCSK